MTSFLPELLLLVVMVGHLVVCPYTKVEESFNLQAMHDLLYHKTDVSQFDHLEFPGVVPRTFLGPIFIANVMTPSLKLFSELLGFTKFVCQYLVRFNLGLCVLFGFYKYRMTVAEKMGQNVSLWVSLITVTQFHFVFYMTRPLPNIFALAIALLAIHYWMQGQHIHFIWYSALVILVFRFELAILLGIMLLMELVSQRLRITTLLTHGALATMVWLKLTVCVDTYFWQRWLWPEGEVVWFNTVLNKSSQWGTLPFLWYFYSALPRSLSCSLALIPLGVWLDRRRALPLLGPALAFILTYSILPHKELRFIIYTLPLLNTVAAITCSRLWQNRNKSVFCGLLALGVVGHLVVNVCTTGVFLYMSYWNYPGGAALQSLHHIEAPNSAVHVHIDVATAQTGVSRFLHLHDHWRYNKTEELIPGSKEMMAYSHLLVGVSDKKNTIKPYEESHEVIDIIKGIVKINVKLKQWPPLIEPIIGPKIYILKRKANQ